MKSNKEFKASVFARAEEQKRLQREKRAARLRITLALLVCAVIAVPAIYIPLSVNMGNVSTAGTAAYPSTSAAATEETTAGTTAETTENTTLDTSVPTGEATAATTMSTTAKATIATLATHGGSTEYTVNKTEDTTADTTAVSTADINATAATTATVCTTTATAATVNTTAATTTAATTAATTTAATTATACTTAATAKPSESGQGGVYFNGAFAYTVQYEAGAETECGYYGSYAEWESADGYADGYVSESFFERNALVAVKMTLAGGKPMLDRIATEGGIKIFVNADAGDGTEAATWIMLVPVPKSDGADLSQGIRVYLTYSWVFP